MNRKMTAVLLVTIGILVLMTACSANKSNGSTAAGNAQESTQKTTQESTQAASQETTKGSAVTYRQYANSRFGFSIEYPDTFTASGSADNDDGTTLSSPDGSAVLTVSGSNNVLDDTVTSMYNTLLAEHSDALAKAYGDDWAEVSWKSGDNIVYEKCVIGTGSVNTFVFKYPAAEKDYYQAVISYIAASFKTPGVGDSY